MKQYTEIFQLNILKILKYKWMKDIIIFVIKKKTKDFSFNILVTQLQ